VIVESRSGCHDIYWAAAMIKREGYRQGNVPKCGVWWNTAVEDIWITVVDLYLRLV
jgi:hypothetical protein